MHFDERLARSVGRVFPYCRDWLQPWRPSTLRAGSGRSRCAQRACAAIGGSRVAGAPWGCRTSPRPHCPHRFRDLAVKVTLGNGVGDAPLTQPGADGQPSTALVADDVRGQDPGPTWSDPGHADGLHDGGGLEAVVGVAAGDREAEGSAQAVPRQVDFAGQAAPRASESRAAEPTFRVPAACWWASTDAIQSTAPATSAVAWRALSIRSKVPSAAHRRNRVCTGAQDRYRSGASRQADPVRNVHTIPFRIIRSSRRFRLDSAWGSSGRTNSCSASDRS